MSFLLSALKMCGKTHRRNLFVMSRRAPIPHWRSSQVRDHTRSRALAPPPETSRFFVPVVQDFWSLGWKQNICDFERTRRRNGELKASDLSVSRRKALPDPLIPRPHPLIRCSRLLYWPKAEEQQKKADGPTNCNPKHTQRCNEIMCLYEHPTPNGGVMDSR